jgi:hypothetical protein
MKPIVLTFASFFVTVLSFAQQGTLYTKDDKAIFDKYASYIEPFCDRPMEKVMEKTAEFFLGTPYVAHTLEMTPGETFVINLREMDCVTFMENVIALSLTAKSGELSFEKFMDELRKMRYRNGNIDDYASRLHYTTDWFYENEKRGLVKNISSCLGGVKETKKISFMSAHRDAYRQLKNDDAMWWKIKTLEDSINKRGGFYYLPKNEIAKAVPQIPHMSIIAFTTSIEGLDTSHVAFAYRQGEKLTFIHASSTESKVVIDEKTLADYCDSQESCTGIMVVKVNDR